MFNNVLTWGMAGHAACLRSSAERVFTIAVLELFTLFIMCGNASPEIRLREPHFTTSAGSITLKKGQEAILFCSVQNLGDRTVVWRKLPMAGPLTVGQRTWVKDSRIHIDHVPNSDQWNLIIEHVDIHDSGQYECQVSFRDKKMRQIIKLTIEDDTNKDAPRIQISGESYLKKGQKLKLICNASLIDDSQDGLYWYKDNKVLTTQGAKRIQVYSSVTLASKPGGHMSSVLEIAKAKPSDSGDYVCKSAANSQMAGVRVEVANGSHNIKREPADPVESMDIQSSPSKDKSVKSGSQNVFLSKGLLLTTFILICVLPVLK